jgi:hypothetical protein
MDEAIEIGTKIRITADTSMRCGELAEVTELRTETFYGIVAEHEDGEVRVWSRGEIEVL